MRFAAQLILSLATIYGALVATQAEPVPDDLCRFAPTCDYMTRGSYLVSYDGSRRTARWTLELLTRDSLAGAADRSGLDFRADAEVPGEFAADPRDYDGSGWDKGHLARAGNHKQSADDMASTFTIANCMAQHPNMNRGCWKLLEDYVAALAKMEGVRRVWCVTAPAWISPAPSLANGSYVAFLRVRTIGRNAVWVPTHCCKSCLVEMDDGMLSCQAWIVPNVEIVQAKFQEYRATTNEVERAIGLDLWRELPDELENRIEGQK